MNDKTKLNSANSGIEGNSDFVTALFQQARMSAPVLSDDNFTKMVINQLPNKPKRQRTKQGATKWLPDSLGLLLGVGIMSIVVGPAELSSVLSALAPSSITLSVTTVSAVAMAFAGLSVLAFWRVEQS